MKDTEGKKNGRRKSPEEAQDDWQDLPVAAYPPELREAVLKGMRILADVAIRSYMEEHAARSQAEDDGDGEG